MFGFVTLRETRSSLPHSRDSETLFCREDRIFMEEFTTASCTWFVVDRQTLLSDCDEPAPPWIPICTLETIGTDSDPPTFQLNEDVFAVSEKTSVVSRVVSDRVRLSSVS